MEKEMVTHSSILVWKTPRTEDSGGLQSMGSKSRTPLSTHTGYSQKKKKRKKGEIITTESKVVLGSVLNLK